MTVMNYAPLYEQVMGICRSLKNEGQFTDALMDKLKAGTASESEKKIREIAESENHFVYDCYPAKSVSEPRAVFILNAHGSFHEVSKREQQIASILEKAINQELLCETDTLLEEGQVGRLSNTLPEKVNMPGLFCYYIENNGIKTMYGDAKGRHTELAFENLAKSKIPIYFCDNMQEIEAVKSLSRKTAELERKLKNHASVRDKYEQTASELIEHSIARVETGFAPGILDALKRGKVWHVLGLNDYTLGVIPRILQEKQIPYIAIAPKQIN
jgi:hypothetical protein